MEMRHGMPVWAPNDLEMSAIANRVAKERSRAARAALESAKHLFGNEYEEIGACVPMDKDAG